MTSSPYLVSTQWLADNLGAPDLVIVDGSWHLPPTGRNGKAEFLEHHIPGAVFFDIDAISDQSSDLPHMLPDALAFSAAVGKLGIGDGLRIVVYDQLGLFSAARVWWTFRAFGVAEVMILDGGLPQWLAEGRETESGPSTRQPAAFMARLDRSIIADIAQVERALTAGTSQVLDARPAARFRGEAPEPRAGIASGHIPGSLNLPFGEIVKDGHLAEPAALRAALEGAGVDLSRPVITSCGSGVSAAILWLALDSIGKRPHALYDGSWAEWASAGKPVATGAE
ncbi:MAG: 3-mercaptopyruvate sulfurtransferase [Rhizobiales bacterium 32-66-11]|jgi:thiosulfate/3-mercaptopyruvate sulfurtransferase|nr:MAG: 3-mercaptopyruvate sulfurtransferase [Rhizobiales bacterium 32-66-11]